MLRNRTVMISLLLALLAATVALFYARSMKLETEKKASIVVAATFIPSKAIMTENMVRLQEVPANQLPPGALLRTSDIVGRVARIDIPSNSPVLQSDLASVAEMGLSFTLTGNRRAISLIVDDVGGLGNLVKIGDTVDVIAVFGNESSKLLLQNIEVLELSRDETVVRPGQPAPARQQSDKATQSSPGKFVTLAMTPEQATKLSLAEANGKIRFILRPSQLPYKSASTSPVTVKKSTLVGRTAEEAAKAAAAAARSAATRSAATPPASYMPAAPLYSNINRLPAEAPAPRPAPPAEKPGKTIEVIRGTQREFVSLED